MKRAFFQKKNLFLLLFGGLFSLLITISIFQLFTATPEEDSGTIPLSGEWEFQINDTLYENVDLSTFSFSETQKGDVLRLSRTLPDTFTDAPEFIFLSCHSTVRILLDGEELYNYGLERANEGLLVGYGNHFVPLPDDYSGKTLTVLLTVTEDHAFTSITSPVITNGYFSRIDYVRSNIFPFFIGVFLLMFGLAFLFLSFCMLSVSSDFLPLVGISLMSVCTGMWTLCSYHMLQLFISRIYVCSYIEYGSLYLMPLTIFFAFHGNIKELSNRVLNILYYLLLALEVLFVATALFCQACNILHFPSFLIYFHVLGVLVLLMFLYATILMFRRGTLESRFMVFGVFCLIIFAGLDLLRFQLEKYSVSFLAQDFTGLLPFGATVFILLLFVSFCIRMTQTYYSKAQQKILEKQANTDSMTGLCNRRRCEQEMNRLDSLFSDTIYGIISLDLNNLKQTNDTFGHECGDELITSFAAILNDIFSPYGMTGRMGGDEFIVLLPDISTCNPKELLALMNQTIHEKNKTLDRFHISVSFGYADSTEDTDAHHVYQIADGRMYEYKRRYKERHS